MRRRRVLDLDEIPARLALEVAVALENHRRDRLEADHEAHRNGGSTTSLPLGFGELRDTFHAAALAALGRTEPNHAPDWDALVDAHRVSPRLVSVGQVAAAMSCSDRKVEQLIADGRLPAVRLDNRVLVRVADLDQFVADLPARSPNTTTAVLKETA